MVESTGTTPMALARGFNRDPAFVDALKNAGAVE
jgi:hypothetical protein